MTETSYDNKYGSGDRRDLIDISSDLSFSGSIKDLIDGTRNTNVYFSNGQNIKDRSIEFLFEERVKIEEVKIIQSSSTLNGEWRIEDERGTIFSDSFEINKPETIVQVKKMVTDHLVIRGVSGATSSGPWLYEVEFKCSDSNDKILIKKDSQYGYYTDSFQSLGTSYPTKEQFEEFGMEGLSILEARDKKFDYEMELINQTDEGKFFSYTFDLNGQHKNMKSIDGIITE